MHQDVSEVQGLDDEARMVVIEEVNSKISGQLAEHFQNTNETVRLQLQRRRKTYKLSKFMFLNVLSSSQRTYI